MSQGRCITPLKHGPVQSRVEDVVWSEVPLVDYYGPGTVGGEGRRQNTYRESIQLKYRYLLSTIPE